MGKDNGLWIGAKIFFLAFFFLFFFYPLALILVKSVSLDANSFSNFLVVLWDKQGLVWNSFFQASVSTFFSLLIGIPAAFIVARRDFPGKKFVKAISLIPFVFPSILVVLAFVIILGNNGWVNSTLDGFFGVRFKFLYGFFGIIAAHVFYNFPLVMRFVSSSWERLGRLPQDSARSLGANSLQVFLRITLPQLLPSIIAAASLVFIFCFMSFAVVLTLGGIQFSTLEVEVYRQVLRNLNLGVGALLALFQFLVLSAFAYIYFHFSKGNISSDSNPEPVVALNLFSARGFAETIFLAFVLVIVLLPIAALLIFAFISPETGEISLDAFGKIFASSNVTLFETTPVDSIILSLGLALFASILAALLGLLASLRQTTSFAVAAIASFSIAVSVITLGFGYFLGFGSGNVLIIGIGHAVLAFPFAYRITKNALDRVDVNEINSARTLGANLFQTLCLIQLPRIKGALLASVAFGFAISLGELGLVLVLYDGVYATMPVYVYRLITNYELFSAGAMGLLLVGASFLAFYAIEHFAGDSKVF
ncbi:MAG: iron ABC transporter permease [archaeon]|nr:iron ABC transporter permease [archaeon]